MYGQRPASVPLSAGRCASVGRRRAKEPAMPGGARPFLERLELACLRLLLICQILQVGPQTCGRVESLGERLGDRGDQGQNLGRHRLLLVNDNLEQRGDLLRAAPLRQQFAGLLQRGHVAR